MSLLLLRGCYKGCFYVMGGKKSLMSAKCHTWKVGLVSFSTSKTGWRALFQIRVEYWSWEMEMTKLHAVLHRGFLVKGDTHRLGQGPKTELLGQAQEPVVPWILTNPGFLVARLSGKQECWLGFLACAAFLTLPWRMSLGKGVTTHTHTDVPHSLLC